MNEDTNSIIYAYLVAQTTLTAVVGTRIYCPRLPENATLPALGFFTRGGSSTPYIPGIVTPSVQFDCWAESPQGARQVYRALYDVLQGIQNQAIVGNVLSYWVSPSSHNDPDSVWTNEANAYDEDELGTWATVLLLGEGSYLELNTTSIYSDRIRIRAATYYTIGGFSNPDIDVDIYYSGDWHNIYSDTIRQLTWVELPIGSSESVTAARIKWNYIPPFGGGQGRIYEFDFGNPYAILSAIEEVQGQDLQDVDIPKYYRVLTFFSMMIRAE